MPKRAKVPDPYLEKYEEDEEWEWEDDEDIEREDPDELVEEGELVELVEPESEVKDEPDTGR